MTFKRIPWEAVIWMFALIILAACVPSKNHITLCPLANLGFEFCPGCGLGRSISFLFHGDIKRSFEAHPLGIFAVIVLSFRIVKLATLHHKLYGQNN